MGHPHTGARFRLAQEPGCSGCFPLPSCWDKELHARRRCSDPAVGMRELRAEMLLDMSGTVLAGGLSRRFGQPKATYMLNGKPMLLYPLSTLLSLCREVMVVGRPDVPLPPLPSEVSYHVDALPLRHPATGIVTALRHAAFPLVFVCAATSLLKVCLFAPPLVDLRRLLRTGATEEDIIGAIHNALQRKAVEHPPAEELSSVPTLPMTVIGG